MICSEIVPPPAGCEILADVAWYDEWRLCSKCQGLFFAGHATHGVCPADHQQHTMSEKWRYSMQNEGPQLDWRCCHQCEGLFFGGNEFHGVCPRDVGPHDITGSDIYSVFFDLEAPEFT